MDEILEQARTLGRKMSEHPRFQAYMDASQQLHDDAEAAETLKAYNEAVATVAQKEQKLEPVEPDDKQKVESLRAVVASNPAVKAFMQAQADYTELMRRVNEAIFAELAPPEAEAAEPGEGVEEPSGPRIITPS